MWVFILLCRAHTRFFWCRLGPCDSSAGCVWWVVLRLGWLGFSILASISGVFHEKKNRGCMKHGFLDSDHLGTSDGLIAWDSKMVAEKPNDEPMGLLSRSSTWNLLGLPPHSLNTEYVLTCFVPGCVRIDSPDHNRPPTYSYVWVLRRWTVNEAPLFPNPHKLARCLFCIDGCGRRCPHPHQNKPALVCGHAARTHTNPDCRQVCVPKYGASID